MTVDIAEVWRESSSRSFYNSPQYADFSSKQGNVISYLDLDGAVLPYARPSVWTYWRSTTRIPIPPGLAPTHSIYYGLLLPEVSTRIPFPEILKRLDGYRWSALFPELAFVQPALLESGPAVFLNEFCEAIEASGLHYAETRTRVLSLPVGEQAQFATAIDISDGDLREISNYQSILASYTKKRRYDVRRAQKEGVTVDITRVTSDELANSVYSSVMSLHRESWTRTGLGPHTLAYWTDLSRAVRESGGHDIVARAYGDDNELLAVVVVQVRGKSTFYQMNSSSLKGQKLSANPACLHAAISAANIWGAEYFELGRYSAEESGKSKSVNDYKHEYGGDILPVPNFTSFSVKRSDRGRRWGQ